MMVRFERQGSYRGEAVHINPDEVASVHDERGESYSLIVITMKNGNRYQVAGSLHETLEKLEGSR